MKPVMSMLQRASAIVAVALACGATACSSSTSNAPGQTGANDVATLEFSPALVVIRKGDTKPIKVTAVMGDGTKKDVTDDIEWSSANQHTATVDEHGTVVGAGAGITTVSATY